MILVVADSSPLIVLINIRYIDILPRLFGKVVIPPQVAAELAHSNRPQPVRAFIDSPPQWLTQKTPSAIETIPLLHPGEVAAISLALELQADLLLIDETLGRKAAVARGIRVAGAIGVLEQAAEQDMIDLKEAFERIKKTDFWISHELLDARLQRYLDARKE